MNNLTKKHIVLASKTIYAGQLQARFMSEITPCFGVEYTLEELYSILGQTAGCTTYEALCDLRSAKFYLLEIIEMNWGNAYLMQQVGVSVWFKQPIRF